MNDNNYPSIVKRIGIPDKFIAQGTVAQLYHQCGMDEDAIYNAIISIKMSQI